ncbi:MAG: phosphoglycerate kinase [Candidatus Pacebacteria bacterium CG_4_10_14_0_8_um_filter_43_12]|nr:MAG: phosphoglycerate kinase [Candidatus Pacebacteria bacterium CG_4_10_14_0_8_um_filter_43_12]
MQLKIVNVSAITNKTVLVRVDYNVPLNLSATQPTVKDVIVRVKDDRRIRDSLETIKFLLKNQAKVVLIAHLGRPKNPADTQFSLEPVAKHLSQLLHQPVQFVPKTVGVGAQKAVTEAPPGSVLLLENLRFHPEEKKNDPVFAKALAKLADVYVNEAFSASHRSHASIVGVTRYLPAYAGFALTREVSTLASLMEKPKKPFVVVLGGAKISDKVGAITYLSKLADIVLIGGAIANNFLKAEGFEIYRSFVEEASNVKASQPQDYTAIAGQLVDQYKTEKILKDGYIPLPKLIYPIDVMAAPSLETHSQNQVQAIDLSHDMADTDEKTQLLYLDIGPKTRKLFTEIITGAGTVFWNGPMGVWENELFAAGTRCVAKAIVNSEAKTVLGGGDTIAAAHYFHYEHKFDYVSVAGGAALEFLSGKMLPGLKPLVE